MLMDVFLNGLAAGHDQGCLLDRLYSDRAGKGGLKTEGEKHGLRPRVNHTSRASSVMRRSIGLCDGSSDETETKSG